MASVLYSGDASSNSDFIETQRSDSSYSETNYKLKLKKLQKVAKSYIFINAALCDQVGETQEKLVVSKEKRRVLAEKLDHLRLQLETDNQLQTKPNHLLTVAPQLLSTTISSTPSSYTHSVLNYLTEDELFVPVKKKAKPKALPSKGKKVLDPGTFDGTEKAVLPITLGSLTVFSIGEVVLDRPDYYLDDILVPVGFRSSRVYASTSDPETKCVYTCKVLDAGNSPSFEITGETDTGCLRLVGKSADECHLQLIERINKAMGSQIISCRPRGQKFFGFSHPAIFKLIKNTLQARKCPDYKLKQMAIDSQDEENEDLFSFDSLQRNISFSKFHMEVDSDVADNLIDTSSQTYNPSSQAYTTDCTWNS